MFKFLITSSIFSVSYALERYYWPPGSGAATIFGTPLIVTDPIGSTNNAIKIDSASASVTYAGLWSTSVTTPTSHTEQAVGGPITKVAVSGAASDALLPLYQLSDVFNPVPAGAYKVLLVNGLDLTYSTSIIGGLALSVTINPYISAWGTTLKQAASNVERGDTVAITFDGLATGDRIEIRQTGVSVTIDCPIDYHTVTAAEAALKRNTIFLSTAQTSNTAVHFGIPGGHTISMFAAAQAGALTYASHGAACSSLSGLAAGLKGVVRTVTIIESDTVAVGTKSDGSTTTGVQAGSSLTLNYNLHVAPTSGTYVGLFLEGANPTSHTVSVAGGPIAATQLPLTGASGAGSVSLKVPITAAAGNYIVMLFNSNDATFTPLAVTSYKTFANSGPQHIAGITPHNTDVTTIPAPTGEPTGQPTGEPSGEPTSVPTSPTGEPTSVPSSAPSFVEEPWGEYLWTEKRHRKAGMCENQCSGHGTCEVNGNCKCFKGLDGEAEWTGPDCSQRTCPFDFAWVGLSINANNLHPWAECSNKGTCDRSSGECQCFTGYEGAACQRTVCPDNCNDQGTCWPEKHLASKAGRVYSAPWDAMKHVGCLCDAGYRGPACDQQECPSGADPLSGYGNEAGRDCSGRGICDYTTGVCKCFSGFFGEACNIQTILV